MHGSMELCRYRCTMHGGIRGWMDGCMMMYAHMDGWMGVFVNYSAQVGGWMIGPMNALKFTRVHV